MRLHVTGDHQQDAVSVDHSAVGVGKQGAIGVSVKRNAQVKRAWPLSNLSGNGFRMQGSALLVDILPVWRCIDKCCLYPQSAEQLWRLGGGGPIGAIYQHSQVFHFSADVLR